MISEAGGISFESVVVTALLVFIGLIVASVITVTLMHRAQSLGGAKLPASVTRVSTGSGMAGW